MHLSEARASDAHPLCAYISAIIDAIAMILLGDKKKNF
jgi:hypothetical protein